MRPLPPSPPPPPHGRRHRRVAEQIGHGGDAQRAPPPPPPPPGVVTPHNVRLIRFSPSVRSAQPPPPPGLAGWLAARRDERADSTLLSRTSGRECVWTPKIELSSRPVCFRSPVRFVPFRPPCYASTRARPAVISSPVSRSRRGQEKRGMKSETVLARRKGTWPVRELNEQRVGRQVQPAMLTCHSRTSCDGQAPSDRT